MSFLRKGQLVVRQGYYEPFVVTDVIFNRDETIKCVYGRGYFTNNQIGSRDIHKLYLLKSTYKRLQLTRQTFDEDDSIIEVLDYTDKSIHQVYLFQEHYEFKQMWHDILDSQYTINSKVDIILEAVPFKSKQSEYPNHVYILRKVINEPQQPSIDDDYDILA